MNEIEMKKNIEKSNKNKNWFFEKINKIEKPLVRLIKKKKKKKKKNQKKREKKRKEKKQTIKLKNGHRT